MFFLFEIAVRKTSTHPQKKSHWTCNEKKHPQEIYTHPLFCLPLERQWEKCTHPQKLIYSSTVFLIGTSMSKKKHQQHMILTQCYCSLKRQWKRRDTHPQKRYTHPLFSLIVSPIREKIFSSTKNDIRIRWLFSL